MGIRNLETGIIEDACLEKLKLGEPFFVLRAQDKTAPGVVRMWAAHAEANNCPPAKVEEARKRANEMEAWQGQNPSKYPD